MSNAKGCFFMRNEGNGCLTSLYLEHTSTEPFTECCIRAAGTFADDPFTGIFSTVWMEPESRAALLTISRNGLVYDLVWVIPDLTGGYRGRAMLSEGKLIGSYWWEKQQSATV